MNKKVTNTVGAATGNCSKIVLPKKYSLNQMFLCHWYNMKYTGKKELGMFLL